MKTVQMGVLAVGFLFLLGLFQPAFGRESGADKAKKRVVEACVDAAETAPANEDFDLAKKYMSMARALDQEIHKSLTARAWKDNHAGRYSKAETASELALLADEEHAPAWRELGYAFLMQKKYDLATKALTMAVKLGDPIAEEYLKKANEQKQKVEE